MRLARVGATLALLAVVFPGPSVTAQGEANRGDLEFRRTFGLSTDNDLMVRLASQSDANLAWGTPLTDEEAAEVERRGRIADQSVGLLEYVFGRSKQFGGTYLDNAAGGVVTILRLESTEDSVVQRARELVPSIADIRVRRVDFSFHQLDSARSELASMMGTTSGIGRWIVALNVDLKKNVVDVRVQRGAAQAVRDFLSARWQQDMFDIHEGNPDTPTACTSRQGCWQDPIRGSLRLDYSINGNDTLCASGPVVYKDAATDIYRIITAGHCFYKWLDGTNHVIYTPDVSHDGHLLGEPKLNTFFGGSSADIALVSFTDGAATEAWAGHKFYRNDNEKASPFTGVKCIGSFPPPITCIMVGDPICKSAYPQGVGCGEVAALDYSSTFEFPGPNNDRTIHDMIKGDTAYAMKVRCGNSGGPVYREDTGILYGIQNSVALADNSQFDNACDNGAWDDFTHAGISALYWLETNLLEDYATGATITSNVCLAYDYFTGC